MVKRDKLLEIVDSGTPRDLDVFVIQVYIKWQYVILVYLFELLIIPLVSA